MSDEQRSNSVIDGLQIGTLRAQAPTGDAGARLPIMRALGAADLRPPGLPAGAVLIVRRLVTERPGTGRAWERAARAQLAELCRRAARPARGESAAEAEAVLFVDAAELLACLADDIVADVVAARWWWRSYLRGRPARVAHLPALLAAEPAALPAALSLLVAGGRAAAVLRVLHPPAARALAEQLAATYALGELPLSQPPAPAGAVGTHHGGVTPPRATSANLASPPWPTLLPELPREQQLLLGLALALVARPAAPRSSAFRRALAAWWQEASQNDLAPLSFAPAPKQAATPTAAGSPASHTGTSAPAPATAPMFRSVEQPDGSLPVAPATIPPRPAALPPPADLRQRTADTDPTAAPLPGRAGTAATPASSQVLLARARSPAPEGKPQAHTVTFSSSAVALPAPPPGRAAAPGTAEHAPAELDHSAAPAGEPTPALAPSWQGFEDGQSTGLGGALFLINLLIYLELPEQFAPTWPLERAVGAWGLLELFARSLLTDPAAHTGDPLWTALAQLDGRPPGGIPAAGGGGARLTRCGRPSPYRLRRAHLAGTARDYQIPTAWLRALLDDPAERFRWASSRCRLRIWSSRGYVLFDGRARRPGRAAARAVLVRLGLTDRPLARSRFDRSPVSAPLAAQDAPAWLCRWLGLTLPYVRFRLALALGLDRSETLDGPLLARRGRLFVSDTHIDLAMSLEATSIAVRLAGLDRNPGWVAEYGRVVLFHFVAPGEQEVWP